MPDKKEKPTAGQKIADKYRKALNQMTEAEREQNFRDAMALIYGGDSRVKCESR